LDLQGEELRGQHHAGLAVPFGQAVIGRLGVERAPRVLVEADRQREVAIANAYRDAQKIKGEGDAQAARLYAESFGRDPQFAQFYRSLEAYKSSFNSKGDVMVLDPGSSEFFKGMRGTPSGAPARK
jgi:membrane protease subunit HflC